VLILLDLSSNAEEEKAVASSVLNMALGHQWQQ